MEIFILFVLIFVNGFFAASEIALVSLNDYKIKAMAEEGHKKAKLVQALVSEPGRFLATIQIGITLAGFLASAFAAGSFAGRMALFLKNSGVPLPLGTLEAVSTVLITLLLSYFTLVLGELVPKKLALQKAEAVSFMAAKPLTTLSKITYPFVKFLTLSTNVITRFLGVKATEDEERVTEEEILMMVDVGKEKGTIQEEESEMIARIFEFDNKTVSDIMTHRTNIAAIPVEYSMKDVVRMVNRERYTRFPVYEGNIDNIVGIFHVKDLVPYLEDCDAKSFSIRDHLHPPYFVLESTRIDHLFREMQKNKVQMAIAIDEYGGTDGIVTIEDLVEEIVGNIFDEYDEPEWEVKEVEQLGDGSYYLAGTLNLFDAEHVLKIDFPEHEYDTLSGFIIGQIGFIPAPGTHPVLEYKGYVFTVEEVNERRIVKVKAERKKPSKEDAAP